MACAKKQASEGYAVNSYWHRNFTRSSLSKMKVERDAIRVNVEHS